MIEEYKKELADLKYKMQKAEEFSVKLPVFSKEILERKLSGDEPWIKFTEIYKSLCLTWGVNRGIYETGSKRTVSNYYTDKPYKEYLFNIYVNTLSVYGSHEKFGLSDIQKETPVFFYDCSNSTFYATDDQINGLLEALNSWHEKASKQVIEFNKRKEIEALKEKLEKLTESET